MPRISLVVPAYNVEDFIGRCLDSIRAQSFEDYEVYVVDDASTDGTAAVAAAHVGLTSRESDVVMDGVTVYDFKPSN